MSLTLHLLVDWDGDGTWGYDEASRVQSFTITRGQKHIFNASGNGFEPLSIGSAELTLRNTDGRFDPFNTTSDIYPNAKPGVDALLYLVYAATDYYLLRGKIADLTPVGYQRSVKISLRDGAQWLDDHILRHATETNLTTDAAIGHVLDAAAWDASWGRALETGDTTLAYWWSDGESAREAIDALVASELGYFYIDGNGQAIFKKRSAFHGMSGEFTIGAGDVLAQGILTAMPWETVRNVAQLTYHPRAQQASAVLWTMQDNPGPYIEPGGNVTFICNFTYNNLPCAAASVDALVLEDGDDYISYGDTPPTLVATIDAGGHTATLTIENTSATTGARLTRVQLTGIPINEPDPTQVEVDNSSGANFGARRLNLDLQWQAYVSEATDLATGLATILATPRPYPQIALKPAYDSRQFSELNTVFRLDLDALYIDAQYRILGIEHTWDANAPQIVNTTWTCAPLDTRSYFTLDDSELDRADILSY